MLHRLLFLFILATCPFLEAYKLPSLTPAETTEKFNEILKSHATYKKLDPEIVKRALINFLDELDPTKTYFIESDIEEWLNPSDALINKIIQEFNRSNFSEFDRIYALMVKVIERRHQLEKQIDMNNLPKKVKFKEFKDLKWATTLDELVTRLERLRALQIESASKLNEEIREKSLQRIQKRQAKIEEEILNPDPVQQKKFILSDVLKAFTSALDTHTVYFTPDEAQAFLMTVQQRLMGIGVQLRDDLNGFTIVKILEGGPAANSKDVKAKDRIIAVNGEPVVGMDIVDAVELIRGPEHTPVTLTLIREEPANKETGTAEKEEKLDVTLIRGEVVLKETRFDSSYEPFGKGIIGYLRLHSFYQDPDSSSADDLAKALAEMKKNHQLEGLIFDLRSNSGGLLAQAVNVAGLFIGKGTVVSIKDETGDIQHLRHLENKTSWDGPLIVLVNKGSASASEIVAQTLQDYGRALIVGDEHTYGKGTFQTFTLNTTKNDAINPEGEYKVTRGIYYTVSGKTPQLNGVLSDIVVPGSLSEAEVGEKYSKYPLKADFIKENYDDDLSDIPFYQRDKVRSLYKYDLQKKLTTYAPYLSTLKKNSQYRIEHDKNYQNFVKEVKKNEGDEEPSPNEPEFGQNDLQLTETYNIMKDLLYLMKP